MRLVEAADRPVATYSRGMRQRLGIAELLMRECRVAVLDEPTSGLDPQSTQELLDLIQRREGMTILLSSHMLDVVQSICHRVALFNKGRIGFVGTVELAARIGGGAFIVDVEADGINLQKAASSTDGVKSVRLAEAGRWEVEATRDVRPDLARLRAAGRSGTLIFAVCASTIVTSNLPFEDWTSVLGSERLTGALLGRLTHHVHILTMNGDSYRLKQSAGSRRAAATAEQNQAMPTSYIPGPSSLLCSSAWHFRFHRCRSCGST